MSCSFIVTDARKYDNPIVYCSATFERLTGYSKHEILGRNCRFLQAPDGDVGAGVKRKYVDDDTVSYLKQQIDAKKEAQASLINYRKGGQPFMNLLTTIPITWDSEEVIYFVGFQVDLVEQPGSVINRNQGNSNKLSCHFTFLIYIIRWVFRYQLSILSASEVHSSTTSGTPRVCYCTPRRRITCFEFNREGGK